MAKVLAIQQRDEAGLRYAEWASNQEDGFKSLPVRDTYKDWWTGGGGIL